MSSKTAPITYDAAGGVITNQDSTKVLLLIRPANDEVRLPKGHMEAGETPKETALREVAEESGYSDLEIVDDLGEQLVVFTLKERIVRRNEHYYLMRARSLAQVTRPQQDLDQFFTVWVDWEEALESITFEAEREWLRRAYNILEQTSL